VVKTDHKPLTHIFKKSLIDCPMRMQRMLLDLQIYDLDVRYKPGKEMYSRWTNKTGTKMTIT
jgi:hypothetical protein